MKKENVIIKQSCHSRNLLSGMTNKNNCHAEEFLLSIPTTGKEQGRDPEQKPFRMTSLKSMTCGFTLIELLVVVLIIGILAAVALPQYQKAVEKSRLAEALHNINAIQTCFDLYRLENGLPSSGRVDLKDMNCPIEANLGELTQDGVFESNHFRYFAAGCNDTFCGAEISRIPSFAYTLVMDSKKGNTCYTQESDLGRYICKSIENQGWAYVDEEY